MRIVFLKWMIIIQFVFLTALVTNGQSECVLKKENGDLKIYTCESGDGKLKMVKMTMTLENTSFRELLDFVYNIEHYTNWQYNTKEARVLHSEGASIIYRTVIVAPWPISNREMITEIVSKFDTTRQELTIDSHNVKYDYPEHKELVRIPLPRGRWQVSAFNSALKVEYTLRIDLGGYVPAWLVNMAMADGPYYSFLKLREELGRKR